MAITANMTTIAGGLTTLLPVLYEKRMLARLRANLQLQRLGQQRSIPRNYGKTVWFNRPIVLTAATTALTEGTTPAATALSSEGVSATAKQYGAWTAKADLFEMTAIDHQWVADEFEYQARLTIDTLIRTEFLASASAIGTALASISSTDVLTGNHVKRMVAALRRKDVPGVFNGDTIYAYVVHPDSVYDLQTDTSAGGWQDHVKYSGLEAQEDLAIRGAVRDIFGARVIESTNCLASADGSASGGSWLHTAYRSMMFGRDAYGVIQIAGGGGGNLANPQVVVKPMGSGGTEDPLNQRSTVGWKAVFVPLFLKTATESPRGVLRYNGATSL